MWAIDLWQLPASERRRVVPVAWKEDMEEWYEEMEYHPMAVIHHEGAWAGFDSVGDRITEWYIRPEDAWKEGEQFGYHPFYAKREQ